ncbi:predicted protein [Clavispora lusitaniae ATCC 42720]|uniref:Uncharacterized protein n=1 Tax=Clavispora lusitaniae (strain ATCC 42720) TaxID=306902 RepID=C4Y3K1_CLAL4|nr:uncharacterized protein CLUG_03114 [Clavispora lusitaniae ATCC 42720]EEQ38988.1 predicted protein [Clavispora lusitaniae ATCC 42720]
MMGFNKSAPVGICAMYCVFCCYVLASPFISLANVQVKRARFFFSFGSCKSRPLAVIRWPSCRGNRKKQTKEKQTFGYCPSYSRFRVRVLPNSSQSVRRVFAYVFYRFSLSLSPISYLDTEACVPFVSLFFFFLFIFPAAAGPNVSPKSAQNFLVTPLNPTIWSHVCYSRTSPVFIS